MFNRTFDCEKMSKTNHVCRNASLTLKKKIEYRPLNKNF